MFLCNCLLAVFAMCSHVIVIRYPTVTTMSIMTLRFTQPTTQDRGETFQSTRKIRENPPRCTCTYVCIALVSMRSYMNSTPIKLVKFSMVNVLI